MFESLFQPAMPDEFFDKLKAGKISDYRTILLAYEDNIPLILATGSCEGQTKYLVCFVRMGDPKFIELLVDPRLDRATIHEADREKVIEVLKKGVIKT